MSDTSTMQTHDAQVEAQPLGATPARLAALLQARAGALHSRHGVQSEKNATRGLHYRLPANALSERDSEAPLASFGYREIQDLLDHGLVRMVSGADGVPETTSYRGKRCVSYALTEAGSATLSEWGGEWLADPGSNLADALRTKMGDLGIASLDGATAPSPVRPGAPAARSATGTDGPQI